MVKATPVAVMPVDEDRTVPQTLAPSEGGNTIFAAWDKFYHVFGVRAQRIDVTPDGVFLVGVTVPLNDSYNLETLLRDTSRYSHRLDLTTGYFWAGNGVPEKPMDSLAISVWLSQWFGGAAGGKRTVPEYALITANDYRSENNLGRTSAKNSAMAPFDPANFDPKVLQGLTPEAILAFQQSVNEAVAMAAQPIGA